MNARNECVCVRVYPMIPSKNCTTQIFFAKREFANNWLHFIRHAFNGASSNHLSVSLSLCLSHSASSLSPYSKFPYSPSCLPLPLTTPLFSPTPLPLPLPPPPSLSLPLRILQPIRRLRDPRHTRLTSLSLRPSFLS